MGDVLIGMVIGVIIGIPLYWAIIAPILRWWRRRV